jgi:hypothetical protein
MATFLWLFDVNQEFPYGISISLGVAGAMQAQY